MNKLSATITVFVVLALISDATEAGTCDLPLVEGPCRAGHQRWGYANGECGLFSYGGCQGNANNFLSEEDCKKECVACSQPQVVGHCRGSVPRWSFSGGECTSFSYGGCGGNGNNFLSEGDCKKECICSQPQVVGPCRGSHPRWSFSGGVCTAFRYGGCGGNENNFMSEEDCQAACSS